MLMNMQCLTLLNLIQIHPLNFKIESFSFLMHLLLFLYLYSETSCLVTVSINASQTMKQSGNQRGLTPNFIPFCLFFLKEMIDTAELYVCLGLTQQ